MLYYSDTFDVSAYWAIVDTPFIESGLLFVDSSEWNDTDYVFISDDPIRFLNTFEFVKQQLSDDSLVFRINTDCNDNGRWDDAELTGIDYNGNGVLEIDDVRQSYNAAAHPDVKSRKRTEDEVLQEFLETFEAHRQMSKGDALSKAGDGKVRRRSAG